ncbi:MAG: hypothetical protein M1837_004297 [Sclerophora amabilis]|nr:MAG: hypothetical protein M1837_004297 [Sclerophora amabilis]
MSIEEKELAQQFRRSSTWYKFFARNGQRTYLERNVQTVLEKSLGAQGALIGGREQRKRVSTRDGILSDRNGLSSKRISNPPKGRGQSIHEIARRLAPFDFGVVETEQVLRLDVKSLKRKRVVSNYHEGLSEEPESKKKRDSSSRCKCEVTIWYVPRSWTGAKGQTVQLLRDSQLCTVSPFSSSDRTVFAAIRLDEPFQIKASKLLVPMRRGNGKRAWLGDNYNVQISLQPLSDENWPPLPLFKQDFSTAMPSRNLPSEPLLHLTAKLNVLPKCPPAGSMIEVKLLLCAGEEKVDTDFDLEVDALWSKPFRELTKGTTPLKPRLITPESEPAEKRSTKNYTMFTFSESTSGSDQYQVFGFLCPFCLHRDFYISEVLQCHLVKNHDRFKFEFEQVTAEPAVVGLRARLVGMCHDLDESTSKSLDRANFDTWVWVQPRKSTFALPDFLSGDSGWAIGKKPQRSAPKKCSSKAKNTLPDWNLLPSAPSKALAVATSIFENTANLPLRTRKRFTVPAPPPAGSYFRTLTKRALRQGELLSESDEDVDESWLKQKHIETIDDFSDVTVSEKKFIKKWDAFLFEEGIPSDKFVREALFRFTRANKQWLQKDDMSVEFSKFATKYVLYGIIDASVVRSCAEIIHHGSDSTSRNSQRKGERVSTSCGKSEGQSAKNAFRRREKLPVTVSPLQENAENDASLCPRCGDPWDISGVAICEEPDSIAESADGVARNVRQPLHENYVARSLVSQVIVALDPPPDAMPSKGKSTQGRRTTLFVTYFLTKLRRVNVEGSFDY